MITVYLKLYAGNYCHTCTVKLSIDNNRHTMFDVAEYENIAFKRVFIFIEGIRLILYPFISFVLIHFIIFSHI